MSDEEPRKIYPGYTPPKDPVAARAKQLESLKKARAAAAANRAARAAAAANTPPTPAETKIANDLQDVLDKLPETKRTEISNFNVEGLNFGRKQRSDAADMAKMKVLKLVSAGMAPADAMREVKRSTQTWYAWQYNSPKFKRQAAEAMAEAERRRMMAELETPRPNHDDFEPVRPEQFKTRAAYWAAFRKAYFNFDTFPHIWKLFEAIENAPLGGITMIQIPPEWMKSTSLNDIMVAELCANPDVRFAYIGENQDFARKQMGRLQRRLEWDNASKIPPLYAHFGPFQPPSGERSKKWNADEITLAKSTHDEADPSVVTVGITGQIRGARWDWIVLDDIQSLKTKGDTKRFLEIIQGDVITRPGKNGRIIFICNRVAKGDVYEEMEKIPGFLDEFVCIPALDLSKPVGFQSNFPRQWIDLPNGDRAPLCDDKGNQLGWDDEDLAQRRAKIGEDQWSRVYMMQPQSSQEAYVTADDIGKATDRERVVGQTIVDGQTLGIGRIAGLDPSLHAHAAFTYCAYDADYLYVINTKDLFKATTSQRIFQEIETSSAKFGPDYWVIENNTLQSTFLTDDAFLKIQEQFGFSAVPHHTGRNKLDESMGIPPMMNAIVRGEIRFPRVTENDTDMALLFDQLMSWRSDIPTRRLRQDSLMSLWFCYLVWKNLRDVAESTYGEQWTRQGLSAVTMYDGAVVNLGEGARPPMTPIWTPPSYKVGA